MICLLVIHFNIHFISVATIRKWLLFECNIQAGATIILYIVQEAFRLVIINVRHEAMAHGNSVHILDA